MLDRCPDISSDICSGILSDILFVIRSGRNKEGSRTEDCGGSVQKALLKLSLDLV